MKSDLKLFQLNNCLLKGNTMKKEFQKKHKAPKGIYGEYLLIIFGVFLLIQQWFAISMIWPVLIIVLGLGFIFISHYKQKRREKKCNERKT